MIDMSCIRHITWLICMAMVFLAGTVPPGLLVACAAGDEHRAVEFAHQDNDCLPSQNEAGWNEAERCLDTAVEFLDEAVFRQSDSTDWSPEFASFTPISTLHELNPPAADPCSVKRCLEPDVSGLLALRSIILQV